MNETRLGSDYSSLLYARPSFLEGIARLFDFGNTLNQYNTSPSPEIADFIAISSDFAAINQDIQEVFARHLKSLSPEEVAWFHSNLEHYA